MLSESQSSSSSAMRAPRFANVTSTRVAAASTPRMLPPAMTAAPQVQAPVLNATTNYVANTVTATKRAQEIAAKDKQDGLITGVLSTASMVGMAFTFLGDLGTSVISKVLTIGAGENSARKRWVDNRLRAPMRAMKNTEFGDFIKSPSKAFGAALYQKQAEFAARSDNLTMAGEKFEKAKALRGEVDALKQTAKQPSRIGGWMVSQINKLDDVSWLKKAEQKIFGGFVDWRHKVNLKKAQSGVEQLTNAVKPPEKPKAGILPSKKTFVSAPPLNTKVADAVSEVSKAGISLEDMGKRSRDTTVAARKVLTEATMSAERAHVQGISSAAKRVGNHAELANFYKGVKDGKGSMIGGLLKKIPKGLGKASLFHVIAGGAIALGAVARNIENSHTNRKGNEGLAEFAADVYGVDPSKVTKAMLTGKDAHPLVAQAASINEKDKRGRNTFNAISNVAEVGNIGTMKAGGEMLMMWYMGGEPLARHALTSENDTLNAYRQLKDAEAGKVQMTPQERVGRIGYLISSVPGFAKNNGPDNRLIQYIATDMAQQGLNTKQIMQTIANPEAIIPMAKVAKEKLAEADAAAAKTAAEAPKPKFADKVEQRSKSGSFAEARVAEKAHASGQTTTRG